MEHGNLKERFEETYRAFFMDHEMVISLPYCINWIWDALSQNSWVHVKQKIPLRMYLWIKPLKEKIFRIKDITYYDLNNDGFRRARISEYSPSFQKLETYLNAEYPGLLENHGWLSFCLFAEIPEGAGLWFQSLATLLLFLWVGLQLENQKINNIFPSDIANELQGDTLLALP